MSGAMIHRSQLREVQDRNRALHRQLEAVQAKLRDANERANEMQAKLDKIVQDRRRAYPTSFEKLRQERDAANEKAEEAEAAYVDAARAEMRAEDRVAAAEQRAEEAERKMRISSQLIMNRDQEVAEHKARADRLAEALRALWDEDAFGPHPALADTPPEPERCECEHGGAIAFGRLASWCPACGAVRQAGDVDWRKPSHPSTPTGGDEDIAELARLAAVKQEPTPVTYTRGGTYSTPAGDREGELNFQRMAEQMVDEGCEIDATPHPEDRSKPPPLYVVADDTYGSWICKDPGGWYHGDGFRCANGPEGESPDEYAKAIAACWEHYDAVRHPPTQRCEGRGTKEGE